MIKIEIIHNRQILISIKELRKEKEIQGFTTLLVNQGYGPMKGDYRDDLVTEEQYYTFIFVPDQNSADEVISKLKSQRAGQKIFCFTTEVIAK